MERLKSFCFTVRLLYFLNLCFHYQDSLLEKVDLIRNLFKHYDEKWSFSNPYFHFQEKRVLIADETQELTYHSLLEKVDLTRNLLKQRVLIADETQELTYHSLLEKVDLIRKSLKHYDEIF